MSTTTLPAGVDAEMRILPVSAIEESLTNPRTHFDPVKLGELAESIAASGVHQPILVRPLPGTRLADTFGFRRAGEPLPTHELVAGARRLRACRMAKVAEIPVMIRPLTDDQVLEIQIVENLQRDDLSELEEAEGYERLMKHSGLTVDQVAGKIGKSRGYVYARLKLMDLASDGRQALREGKIDASKALLIARVPDSQLQAKALAKAVDTDWRGDPSTSYRELQQWVRNNVMLRLADARFAVADPTLGGNAGPCGDCIKRTGANPDLFADVDGPDICTDPPCFRQKEEDHDLRQISAANQLGRQVIAGDAAREIMPHRYMGLKGYTRVDQAATELGTDNKPLRKVLGNLMPEPVILVSPHTGEQIAVIKTATAKRLIANNGLSALEKRKEQQAKKEAAAPIEDRPEFRTRWQATATQRIDDALKTTATALPLEVLRNVMHDLAYNGEEDVWRLALDLDEEVRYGEAAKRILTLPDHALVRTFMRYSLHDAALNRIHDVMTAVAPRHPIVMLAELENIDLHEIQAATKREMESEERAKAMQAEVDAAAKAGKRQKASVPHAPAAPAAGGAGGKTESGVKPKKPAAKTSPAARAVKPKATAAEASRDIAAALQAAGGADPGAADAAQSDEAHPRLRADAVASATVAGPAAQTLQPAWPFPGATKKPARGTASAPSKNDQPAEQQLGLAVGFMAGQRVEVKPNATGPGAKYRGRMGNISSKMGDRAYMVTITGRNGGLAKSLSFDESELEAVPV